MIGIIDYGMGNLRSVAKAFELLGAEVLISGNSEELVVAEKLVLPGVGAFGDGMENLRKRGLVDFLDKEVNRNGKMILGICLGMQLLAERGFERGENRGLGWIGGEVRKFSVDGQGLKVPHVGWNEVRFGRDDPLFRGIRNGSCFYFVHSYHMACRDRADVLATCNYGHDFTAAVRKKNIMGTQFHPEKSQDAGLRILENYLNMGVP
ncbi:MAG TPA: imidazole glycerol phosphate synthase subunit HisH [Candidatus Bilamarchaeaceae archaeon]|nr:imidazole glycerol phosphate synthase subunit HisH [Candidatus Bilamarchaeaceae archaeon]